MNARDKKLTTGELIHALRLAQRTSKSRAAEQAALDLVAALADEANEPLRRTLADLYQVDKTLGPSAQAEGIVSSMRTLHERHLT